MVPAWGLSSGGRSGFLVRNRTDAPITVRVVDPTLFLEVEVAPCDRGELPASANGCLDRPVAAFDARGTEIARLEQGACSGRVWSVNDDGAHLEN